MTETAIVKLPDLWQEDFRRATFRTGFNLSLSQAMIEFLCAVADDVRWERGMYGPNIHQPDNWVATEASLTKRGLIVRKSQEESAKYRENGTPYPECCFCKLTPAGAALVQLFRVTGVFVQSDAAINKAARS